MRSRIFMLVFVGIVATWSPQLAADDCTGSRTYTDGNGKLHVLCVGSCSPVCKERTGSDALGNFFFCGCNGTDYDTCCTVVVRGQGSGETPYPDDYGSCTASGCPGGGPCQLQGAQNQPTCPN